MSDTPTPPPDDDEPPAPRPGTMRPDDLPPEIVAEAKRIAKEQFTSEMTQVLSPTPRPINWRTLPPHDLERELLELNQWVDWLRHTYGLPAQVIPPMWHRHPELLWELSALRQHWLFCFDPAAKGNQALAWHHDFAVARERLRDWVTISGTRLDRDRPTRITAWPGGEPEGWEPPDTAERPVTKRSEDFVAFVAEQVADRKAEQEAVIRQLVNGEQPAGEQGGR